MNLTTVFDDVIIRIPRTEEAVEYFRRHYATRRRRILHYHKNLHNYDASIRYGLVITHSNNDTIFLRAVLGVYQPPGTPDAERLADPEVIRTTIMHIIRRMHIGTDSIQVSLGPPSGLPGVPVAAREDMVDITET